jgi:acetyl-CoA decarbonylase/synthase complex subunit delta
MEYKAPVESYSGVVREEIIGIGEKALKLGGENILPFHFFDEGSLPNPPAFALEIADMEPEGWPEHLVEPFKDVISDPVKWAQKCEDLGADAVFLRLTSTDPAAKDSPADEAAALTKKVAESIGIPLIVYGSGDDSKDAEVLPKVAEVCDGMNLLIGPVHKENYEVVGRAILDHGHKASADSFSLMERVKQLGVIVKDSMTQMPIIADLGRECWKTKQAMENKEQGLLWEGITALSLILAGANILVLRHPDNIKLVKETIGGEVWQK